MLFFLASFIVTLVFVALLLNSIGHFSYRAPRKTQYKAFALTLLFAILTAACWLEMYLGYNAVCVRGSYVRVV